MEKNIVEFLDLGLQPFANKFTKIRDFKKKEKKYNLKVCFNKRNYLVSIKKPFSSKKMFDDKYPYRSSMSKAVTKSFLELSKKIKKEIKPKRILEIGSNDGSFMQNFNKSIVVGIEPCKNVEKITKRKKFSTYSKYWNNNTAKFLKKKYKNFDLVFSANTISHIKDLDNVFKNIKSVLSERGTLIIEDPSLLECLKTNTYDQFYNEHIYVFSCLALNEVLKQNGLEIYKVDNIKLHGGSNRYYIKKIDSKKKMDKSFKIELYKENKFKLKNFSTYLNFKNRVQKSKKELIKIFTKILRTKSKIIGYGATAKSTTVLNYCKLNHKHISYFLDTTPDKQNRLTPGTKIIVKKYKNGISDDIKYAFLGAWNFKEEIFKKEKKFRKRGGKFIVHTPYPKVI